eukprot:911684-Amphidinium_carterae.1
MLDKKKLRPPVGFCTDLFWMRSGRFLSPCLSALIFSIELFTVTMAAVLRRASLNLCEIVSWIGTWDNLRSLSKFESNALPDAQLYSG